MLSAFGWLDTDNEQRRKMLEVVDLFIVLYRRPLTLTGSKDNSVLRMLENNLINGAIYSFRDPQTSEYDEDGMLAVLKDYWTAVSHVLPEAWNKPPRRSRLMHGVGIASLGFLMDTIRLIHGHDHQASRATSLQIELDQLTVDDLVNNPQYLTVTSGSGPASCMLRGTRMAVVGVRFGMRTFPGSSAEDGTGRLV